MTLFRTFAACLALAALPACERLGHLGSTPDFTTMNDGNEVFAMNASPFPAAGAQERRTDGASLWTAGRRSLLGDRRAGMRGDILTVVIEIDDSAEISNSSERERSAQEQTGLPEFFGLPGYVDRYLPSNGSLSNAVGGTSTSQSAGEGSVRRNEELTLRIAATVVEVLQNGVLRIEGSQEVRVNFEIRELLVSGYVRPEDVSRQNEITYDKIAGARISYGGRGQISDVQQPRYGQQILDIVMPF